jgi:hypothetical protein
MGHPGSLVIHFCYRVPAMFEKLANMCPDATIPMCILVHHDGAQRHMLVCGTCCRCAVLLVHVRLAHLLLCDMITWLCQRPGLPITCVTTVIMCWLQRPYMCKLTTHCCCAVAHRSSSAWSCGAIFTLATCSWHSTTAPSGATVDKDTHHKDTHQHA